MSILLVQAGNSGLAPAAASAPGDRACRRRLSCSSCGTHRSTQGRAADDMARHGPQRRESDGWYKWPGRGSAGGGARNRHYGLGDRTQLVAAGMRTTVWDRSASVTALLSDAGGGGGLSGRGGRGCGGGHRDAADRRGATGRDLRGEVAGRFALSAVWAQMGTIGLAVMTQVAGRLGPMSCSPTRRYRQQGPRRGPACPSRSCVIPTRL
jgi:hypothetical protein